MAMYGYICFALGCSRSRNRHAIQHSIQHTPRVISMKLNTLEMWCYVCEKWIGTPDSPQDERAFVVDWQTRLLMSSANLSCAQFPIDKSTQLPILSRNLLGYPLPPVTSLWYAAGWNERRQREREIPFTLENDPFCFVAQSWMRAWSEFLLGNAPPPGPVDNSSLVVPVNQSTDTTVSGSTVSYQLRSDIQPDIHFWIISTRAWTVIEQFYGGGPHLGEKDLEGIDYNELLIYMASIREQIQEDLDINHSDEDEEEEEEEEEADRHSDEDEQIIMLL
ncbi:hypothetical protein BDF19DRAFT_127423 [Syncephalis fuscata]|nr:hypothetical protein BDF19DRAFT_127423 [Syncephalis fuscata]